MFSGDAVFTFGVSSPQGDLPPAVYPEIVFAGRSNSGKSSLINAVTFRKKLVRTSSTPGCTAQINFFTLRDKIYLVDVPGYGYAKTSKKEMNRWKNLIESYFVRRAGDIVTTCILLDSRRGLKETDRDLAEWLDHMKVPFMFVLTKADKAKRQELDAAMASVTSCAFNHMVCEPIATSVKRGDNLEELRALLALLGENRNDT